MTSAEIVQRVKALRDQRLRDAGKPVPEKKPPRDSAAVNRTLFRFIALGGFTGLAVMTMLAAIERPAALLSLYLFFGFPMAAGLGTFWREACGGDEPTKPYTRTSGAPWLVSYALWTATVLTAGTMLMLLPLAFRL